MDSATREHYRWSNEWAEARRRHLGVGIARPYSPVHPSGVTPLQASRITTTFADDLLVLGWPVAVLLDEENSHNGYERSRR